jgi:EAL domain-containing protein (putative c-di-GMP-specific phosphodiesterase class I)
MMKLPFDVLKIDVSFVRDMFQSKQKEAIVQTIVQLAHNLGLKVVAEGVETEKHFDYLSSLGCDYFQGYLFSKPVAEPEFRQQNQ